MARPDLNLLFTLDVLLAEGSVARAARRLHLSPSAMSRALARLREATGDPLLVRAGRGLVASPRALELRDSVSRLVHEAEAALRPAHELELGQLERTFTIRASEGFVENFGARLLARVGAEAPGVRLHFMHKLDKSLFPQAAIIPLLDKHHIITQVAGHAIDVLKLLAPLVINEDDVQWFLRAFADVMDGMRRILTQSTS